MIKPACVSVLIFVDEAFMDYEVLKAIELMQGLWAASAWIITYVLRSVVACWYVYEGGIPRHSRDHLEITHA